jgi:hypothetical protein
MQAYPGYTVRGIEDELSWREVDELFRTWEREPPAFATQKKIAKMIEKWGGFKSQRIAPLGGQALEDKLNELGWLK